MEPRDCALYGGADTDSETNDEPAEFHDAAGKPLYKRSPATHTPDIPVGKIIVQVEPMFGFSKNDKKRFDCLANAESDEPLFVLLARDVRAPPLIEQWADVSEKRGTDPAKVADARECARQMREWRAKNRPGPEPNDDPELAQTQADIAAACDEVKDLLLSKNRAYGSSFDRPLRVFCKMSPREQITARIDDKLNRIAKGSASGEDVTLDLIGYLILDRVLARREARKADAK
jgi:hypothetical protein